MRKSLSQPDAKTKKAGLGADPTACDPARYKKLIRLKTKVSGNLLNPRQKPSTAVLTGFHQVPDFVK
jgi:hypothetical protein